MNVHYYRSIPYQNLKPLVPLPFEQSKSMIKDWTYVPFAYQKEIISTKDLNTYQYRLRWIGNVIKRIPSCRNLKNFTYY